ELAVIRELWRAGRRVSVGLEMYPAEAQPALNDWTAGKLSEAEFLERSGWMKHWSYNWDYYRGIFVFARDNGIRLFGVNVAPELGGGAQGARRSGARAEGAPAAARGLGQRGVQEALPLLLRRGRVPRRAAGRDAQPNGPGAGDLGRRVRLERGEGRAGERRPE